MNEPIFQTEYEATRVELVRGDFGRSDRLTVLLSLHMAILNPDVSIQRVDLTLDPSYTGKFHAGQKFILAVYEV